MYIPTREEQMARYEREKWEYEHPFQVLLGEILDEIPILYLFLGWTCFFLLFSSKPIIFYGGIVGIVIWLLELAWVMSEDN